MTWFSFKTLDEFFDIPHNGDGCDIDFKTNTGFTPAWNKGIPHTEETKKLIGDKSRGRKHTQETKDKMSKNQPKTKINKGWCDEAKKRRSEMQKGKKRGPYKKSTKVRSRDKKGRFLPDK